MCFTPTQVYEMACYTSLWADEDPSRCGCRGRGWMLSDVDTWHQCPAHGRGVMHPEEAEYEAEIREEVESAAKAAGLSVEAYLASLDVAEPVAVVADDDGIPF